MPRWIRIGRFVFNADRSRERTGLEEEIVITGDAAQELLAYFAKVASPWHPVRVGPHPRGPLRRDRL